jgi:purine-cytosine permease-like protein
MPMGAVIFVDFWLVERAGLKSGWAARRGLDFNWAAGAAWFVTLAACAWLVLFGGIEIFFVSLPGWFIAAVVYIVASRLVQGPGGRSRPSDLRPRPQASSISRATRLAERVAASMPQLRLSA